MNPTSIMELIINPDGQLRCVYDEAIDLAALGVPQIQRASHVEPVVTGGWTADLGPIGGPVLGPFARRSDALAAEHKWLREHWLLPESPQD